MDIKPIRRPKVYEEVVEQIKDLITNGSLGPGEKLPSERELAEKFEVSRSSIRQALMVLEMSGVIERRKGEGTYSKQGSLFFQVAEIAKSIMMIKTDSVHKPMEARRVIEPHLARLATLRATTEDLKNMEKALEMQKQALGEILLEKGDIRNCFDSAIKAVEGANSFHRAIAVAAGNEILLATVDNINKLSFNSRELYYEFEENNEVSLQGHMAIFKAIKEKDDETAYNTMKEHLGIVEDLLACYK